MGMIPLHITDVFDPDTRERLLSDSDRILRKGLFTVDEARGRITSNDTRLFAYLERLLPAARQVFNDETILPSYLCWARYSRVDAYLEPHKDSNACTFTIDYCVRQQEPWDLFVEGTPYTLQENEALAFMGEDQEHWRGPFKPGNMVEMIFFHYVRPDHWYFTD